MQQMQMQEGKHKRTSSSFQTAMLTPNNLAISVGVVIRFEKEETMTEVLEQGTQIYTYILRAS